MQNSVNPNFRTEQQFQDALTTAAEQLGWSWWHDNSRRVNQPGWLDLTMIRTTRILVAELKLDAASKQPTADQIKWLNLWKTAGAETYLWRPRHYHAAISILSDPYRVRGHETEWTIRDPNVAKSATRVLNLP